MNALTGAAPDPSPAERERGWRSRWVRVGLATMASWVIGCSPRAQVAAPQPPAVAGAEVSVQPAPATPKPEPTALAEIPRAERRAYDGGPPVIPHDPMEGSCLACHDGNAAPAFPHANTAGLSEESRCVQCHVYRTTDALFTASAFAGYPQDVNRRGERKTPKAAPKRPHRAFMRDNCLACHSGEHARAEIKTSHPERPKCALCHPAGEED